MTRSRPDLVLFSPQEMKKADQRAAALGISEVRLIENGGRAVADAAVDIYVGIRKVAVLAGHGNNGADAISAATQLIHRGYDVELFSTTSEGVEKFRPLAAFMPERYDLIIDGLLGAGISRPIEGEIADVIYRTNSADVPILAIDLPSGISGRTGKPMGVAINASSTVTFERRKPGHLLMPGRRHCGEVRVAAIGMPAEVLRFEEPCIYENHPDLWRDCAAMPLTAGHKYDRGHAVVFSGPSSKTGAARMSAMSALRMGAGLVTVFSPSSAMLVNAAQLTAIMLARCEDGAELTLAIADKRLNAFLLGPGFGIGDKARHFVRNILGERRRLVLDADGITSFQDDPEALFESAQGETRLILTPHEGEFSRLFPDLSDSEDVSKVERATAAAKRANAVVILKGADTVVAEPGGRAVINTSGTPWLATAGTGDVLAGMVTGQLAKDLPLFEAACSAVWMHGMAARHFGPGLIAEDLPRCIPSVLRDLLYNDA